jgi:tripartite ATP-independent transporter DctM subunit
MGYAAAFVALLLIGMPIAFLMGLTALLFVPSLGVQVLPGLPQRMFVGVNKFVLMAIPFFILAGSLMNHSGISRRLIAFARNLVGWISGGLAMTTVLSTMVFAGGSGSAQADAAAMGSVLIPAMKDEGYDAPFAVGIVVASSVITPIIPPSIIMIILAVVGEMSVAALFLGGIVPGLLIGVALMAFTYLVARRRNYPRGPRPTVRGLLCSFIDAVPALVMPVIIVGGILSGWFTPTEAAAVAAAYAFLVGFFFYGELRLSAIPKILLETAAIHSAIMIVMATAYLLSWMITLADLPLVVAELLTRYPQAPWVFLLLVNVLLLFVGLWMDPAAALIVLVPILLPVAIALEIDPIHFGIIICLNLVIGMVTPPVGYVLYTIAPIARMSIEQITMGVLPFLAIEIVVLFAITYMPQLTLALPSAFGLIR